MVNDYKQGYHPQDKVISYNWLISKIYLGTYCLLQIVISIRRLGGFLKCLLLDYNRLPLLSISELNIFHISE